MRDRRLLERIDACRPGSDDLHDPSLPPLNSELADDSAARALYQRVQALDEQILEALDDVPLPEGLQDRLLMRLTAERIVDGAAATAAPATPATAFPDAVPTRRRWLRWGIGLATAASIAAMVVLASWPGQPRITAANLNDQVRQFADVEEPHTAESIEKGLPRGFPFSRHVHRLPRTQWRPVYGFLDRTHLDGVAYEMIYRGAVARLYVVPLVVDQIPTAPPARLDNVTGNRAIAAWQENGLLYVLVVHGDNRTYQSFVRRPTVG